MQSTSAVRDEEMDPEGEIKSAWNEMQIVIFSFPSTFC